MNKEIIDNALLYYGINDEWYRKQCYACMKTIETDNHLMQKFEELLDVLYVDKTQKINRLWSIESIEELFHQPVHPFVTSGINTYITDDLGYLLYQCASCGSWTIAVRICRCTYHSNSYSG